MRPAGRRTPAAMTTTCLGRRDVLVYSSGSPVPTASRSRTGPGTGSSMSASRGADKRAGVTRDSRSGMDVVSCHSDDWLCSGSRSGHRRGDTWCAEPHNRRMVGQLPAPVGVRGGERGVVDRFAAELPRAALALAFDGVPERLPTGASRLGLVCEASTVMTGPRHEPQRPNREATYAR